MNVSISYLFAGALIALIGIRIGYWLGTSPINKTEDTEEHIYNTREDAENALLYIESVLKMDGHLNRWNYKTYKGVMDILIDPNYGWLESQIKDFSITPAYRKPGYVIQFPTIQKLK